MDQARSPADLRVIEDHRALRARITPDIWVIDAPSFGLRCDDDHPYISSFCAAWWSFGMAAQAAPNRCCGSMTGS
jgi:hypothetical protein